MLWYYIQSVFIEGQHIPIPSHDDHNLTINEEDEDEDEHTDEDEHKDGNTDEDEDELHHSNNTTVLTCFFKKSMVV